MGWFNVGLIMVNLSGKLKVVCSSQRTYNLSIHMITSQGISTILCDGPLIHLETDSYSYVCTTIAQMDICQKSHFYTSEAHSWITLINACLPW